MCSFQLARAEEVEVVEAIPGEESRNENSALNRQDNELSGSDQLALDTIGDSKDAGGNHYKAGGGGGGGGLRGHPLLPPGRGALGLPSRPHHNVAYHGPPPPLPPAKAQPEAMDKIYTTGSGGAIGNGINAVDVEPWPAPTPDLPKIVSLDVKCEKSLMKVYLGFDKPFYGIVFSKGHYSNVNCVHLPAGLGRTSVNFEISIHACGTAGNTKNELYGYGAESGSGTFFENIIVVQYDPQVQEVWDQARKLRCTWHDLYEKSVTFRPFPVDMLDVVRADFAGDNVGCWMQIQVGKGPWASEVSGLVKIGQTMTMVLAIKDDDSKFDMLVRNCMAHDGKRAPIQLVDQRGCITRPKLMSRFTKIKNFGASASVLSYAHFQAFKFPDSMEVHFQCTIQICRYQCPDQCSDSSPFLEAQGLLEGHHHHPPTNGHTDVGYGPPPLPLEAYLQAAARDGRPRDERRRKSREIVNDNPQKAVGVNRIIRVVSTGDLTFSIDEGNGGNGGGEPNGATMVFPQRPDNAAGSAMICMTTPGFAITLIVLLAVLLSSCVLSAYLFMRLRPFSARSVKKSVEQNAANAKKSSRTCFS